MVNAFAGPGQTGNWYHVPAGAERVSLPAAMPEPSANCNERRTAEAARVAGRRLDLLRFAASSVDSGVHADRTRTVVSLCDHLIGAGERARRGAARGAPRQEGYIKDQIVAIRAEFMGRGIQEATDHRGSDAGPIVCSMAELLVALHVRVVMDCERGDEDVRDDFGTLCAAIDALNTFGRTRCTPTVWPRYDRIGARDRVRDCTRDVCWV